MKKLLLTLFAAIAFLMIVPAGLTSCTKDVPTHDTVTVVHNDTTFIRDTIVGVDTNLVSSSYYVKATINGTNVNFTNYTRAVASYGGSLTILGHNNPDYMYSDGITLELAGNSQSNSLPVAGTYSITSPTSTLQVFQAFVINSGLFYDVTAGSPTLDFHCTITTINSTYVSGTFYGTAYSGKTPETITNGSFYVPF